MARRRTPWAGVLLSLALLTGLSALWGAGAPDAGAATAKGWAAWGHFPSTTPGRLQPAPDHRTAGPGVGPRSLGTSETDLSSNWAGYVETGTQFTGISAQWVVPSIQPSGVLAASSEWVGIDGATNSSLIQTGTSQETFEGITDYEAWYEILPDASVTIGSVSPGDEMQAEVFEDSPGVWTISIADVTSDQSTSGEVSYDGPADSAEWIEEDPTIGDVQPPLANFGTVQFSQLQSSGVGQNATVAPVDMVDQNQDIIARAGNLVNDGFAVTYDSPAPPLSVTTASLPAADVNTSYAQTLTASGGTAPYTWAVSGGTLPTGLTLDPSSGAITGDPTVAGDRNVTFKVTDSLHQSATATLSFSIDVPGPYTPLAPVRICDTRPVSSFTSSNQCDNGSVLPLGAIAAGGIKTINVANGSNGGLGSFGVPDTATSVVLNVTAVSTAAPGGYMTVFPAGAVQPNASNLNYGTGVTVPNLVQVGVGVNGDVSFFSSSQTDLVVDVEGYSSPTSLEGAGLYDPLASPDRVCDTRAVSAFTAPNQCDGPGSAAGTLTAGGTVNVGLTDDGPVPSGATAAVLNVTVANPALGGYLTVYPEGSAQPTASNVNFVAGQATANRVIVPLSGSGGITVFSSEPTDVIIDVSGYYTAAGGQGAQFSAEAAPVRICDTRPVSIYSPANQCTNHPIGSGGTLNANGNGSITVAGLAGVPDNATAVVVNLTGVAPTLSTFLTVFPGLPRPNSSDLNPTAGETSANLAVATLSPSGTFDIYNNTGDVNVIVDVLGWYS